METDPETKMQADPNDRQATQINEAAQNPEQDQAEKKPARKHHDDHSVSRKYRMFSNYSSDRDMPHTNTSF